MNAELYFINGRGNSKSFGILGNQIRTYIEYGIPVSKELLNFLERYEMSTGIVGGYKVDDGYMGYINGHYEKFESEEAYLNYIKEMEEE